MKTKISLLVLLALIVSNSQVNAQKKDKKITITGYVIDQAQTPVVNAVVTVDGLNTGVVTEKNGYYKVKVKSVNSKIGIISPTTKSLEQPIDGRSRINFQFEGSEGIASQRFSRKETDPGDEPVNVGYTTVKKKSLTTSVSKIDGTNPKYASYNSICDMLRGEIPGVVVTGTTIRIRNPNSINANNDPLFVVDGVPVLNIDGIKPQMVKSIHVLKGSDASIYGVRGSSGVILIDLLNGRDN